MLKLSVIVLAALIGMCSAYGVHDHYFPEDKILECNVINPRYGERDQPPFKQEEIPIVPFHIVETTFLRADVFDMSDVVRRGSYFAPQVSNYQSPVVGEFSGDLTITLLEEVGSEINSQVSDTGAELPRSRNEAIAATLIPLRYNTTPNASSDIVIPTQSRMADINATLDSLGITNEIVRDIVIDAMRTLNLRCIPIGGWVRLPMGQYFPEWLYAAFCQTDEACSLPPGLRCEPVVAADSIAHTIFLRWDCCWSFDDNKWVWKCGWRKVYVPHIGRCHCGCGVIFENIHGTYGYMGGVGDPSFLTEGRDDPFISNPV